MRFNQTGSDPALLDMVRLAFFYDEADGVLIWRYDWGLGRAGEPAGKIKTDRHGNRAVVVGIDGKSYLAHRLIWFWKLGVWPTKLLDHRDRNSLNNRWDNLREASRRTNRENSLKARRGNRSGLIGVSLTKHGTFKAAITTKGRRIRLGTFKTGSEASGVYLAAKPRYHKGFVNLEENS